jgi:hypothetical protein
MCSVEMPIEIPHILHRAVFGKPAHYIGSVSYRPLAWDFPMGKEMAWYLSKAELGCSDPICLHTDMVWMCSVEMPIEIPHILHRAVFGKPAHYIGRTLISHTCSVSYRPLAWDFPMGKEMAWYLSKAELG